MTIQNRHSTDILDMVRHIMAAADRQPPEVLKTPLQRSERLSQEYASNIYLKREDLQIIRSYKLRGAFNLILSLSENQRARGVVCASAGNHAQGVALACNTLGIHGRIFMPVVTPNQKIRKVRQFGGDMIEVVICGDQFDETYEIARANAIDGKKEFIHPFDDDRIIAGQGTVGMEILEQLTEAPDFILMPVGGGGLAAGVCCYTKQYAPAVKLIGAEPQGAPSMSRSIAENRVVELERVDPFVDGAAVKKPGTLTFSICNKLLDGMTTVNEGKICSSILQLYNEDAIVLEPAGALSIAALDQYRDQIRGKTVVCVLSGGNNDIMRMEEIKERSLLHEGLKHYFIIRFPQRAGALKDFLFSLGPEDDITHFQYTKKTNRMTGPAIVGIELKKKEDFALLIKRMEENEINFLPINNDPMLFEMLI